MHDTRRKGFRETSLYRPKSLVLVADPVLPAAALLARNIAAGAFAGPRYVVGLAAEGLCPLDSVADLPAPPDLAVLALPPAALDGALAALAACGARAAIVPGEAPERLGAMTARHGLRALGPASFGVAVPGIGLNATLSHLAPRPGRLALLCQSGALARSLLDWAEAESVGFSHVIGIGTNGDLGFAHALDWLSRDPGTGAVLLDLRRITNRRLFVSAARAVARTRPVVAMRPGGRLDDPSGMADAVMQAALRRAGVLVVEGLEAMLSAAETLARTRLAPRGGQGRVAVLSNGWGLGRLAADAVLARGDLLAGPPETLAAADATSLAERAAARMAEPGLDALILAHAPAGEDAANRLGAALGPAARAGRGAPVLLAWTGQATAGAERAALARAGLAVFATPEEAAEGAHHLLTDRRNRAAMAELPGRDVLALAPDRARIATILAAVRAEGRLAATEDEALAVLAAYGMPVVAGRVAATPEAAAEAAQSLGFPVVLKLRSAAISRKTEVGGVVLNLVDAPSVAAAARTMQAGVAARRPDLPFAGFLVQRQAPRALELRLWLAEEPMFGPWIGFGLGGTAGELLGDTGIDLPPLNVPLAEALIGRTRAAMLLAGYRDHPRADRQAVAEALVRLSQLAVDFPEIAALGINPLFAGPDGVLACDASLDLRPAGERSLLAIPPYPEEWVGHVDLRDGRRVTVRPIRPEDATAHAAFIRRLPPEDLRYRFFSQIRELPAVQTARLTQIDYDREMAFCAIETGPDGTELLRGVSRLIREPEGDEGEFAVIVDAAMKGQGLAAHLMRRLFAWAPEAGIREIVGQVLRDNAPMLAFMRHLGFTLRRSPEDEDIVEARFTLK
jgi:acetyltransferase